MTQPTQQPGSRPCPDAGPKRSMPAVGAVLGGLLLGGGAMAQAPAPGAVPQASATPAEPSAALTTLADQVEYWRAQNRPELAFAAVERLLAASPRDPDVLASAAAIAAQLGRPDEADSYLATLRRVAPNDPRIPVVERQRSFGDADRAALAEARALGQSGRAAEALSRYQALFPNGNVPDNLAPEYYQTMAGIDYQHFRDATGALRQRLERDPDNQRMRLTLAQIQTYRETTRYSGIETLRELAGNSALASPARAAWRQALLWEGPSGELITAIETYLASNPSDPQIDAKLREARGTLPDAGTQARIDGYQSVESGQLAEAERQFRTSLQTAPDDPGALAGLGLVRWRQGHPAEARDLRDRAIAVAPERREEFMTMFTGLDAALRPAGNGGGGRAPAVRIPPSPSVQARQALARGNLDQADDFARRAARSNANEQVQAEVILGQIALRRDDLTTAETRFRAALARRPGLPEALGGLYDVLQRQNRFAEAEALQQETGFRPGSVAGLATQRAYALRDQAGRSEPDVAIDLLAQAKTVDPKNPWVRLDRARLLRAQGQEAEAAREEQELTGIGSNDATYAAALLAQDDERYAEVVARLEGIPARVRSADANRLLTQARQEQEIGRLETLARNSPRSDAMPRLVALAARPDPSGTMAAGVVRALGRLQQPEAAAQAARTALTVNRNATPDARIQLAGALLSARRVEDADAITASLLAEGRLTEEQRRQIASLSAGSAVVQAGQLSAEGNQRAALAQLQPALRDMPDNPAVNLALARVYLASDRATEAQGIADAVLARNPGSLEALTVAADAAMARQDWRRADALLQEGRSRFPADPQVMLLEARRASAQGDHYRALRALESAGVRRYAQLQAGGGNRGSDAELLAARLRGGTEDARTGGAEISDPVASQIVNELAAARQETVTWLQAGLGVRGRSGQGGLSKLTEITAPVEVSAAVPGIGGRVTAKAETVSLDTGSIGGDLNALRQFGSNALGGGSAIGLGGGKGHATGVALNVGYAYGDLKADIGSTPLGFRIANAVGGLEYAPSLTDRLRLRVTGERRAVTDSMLSYAGLRDGRTGTSWGGVTSTGGRAQLEYTVGDAVLYGGGGYAAIDGRHVASNSRFDLGGGIAWTVLRQPDQSVVLGLDARYAAYDKNLRYFTLGQGGYFSPQSQLAAVVQADWRKRIGDLRLRLGGAVGYQTYREDDSPVFPNNPGLQAQLVAAAAGDSTLNARYAGRDGSGVIGNLRAEAEYDITPQLRIGAYATYDRSGDWKQATGMVRLRYAFEQAGPDLNTALPPR